MSKLLLVGVLMAATGVFVYVGLGIAYVMASFSDVDEIWDDIEIEEGDLP